MPQEVYRETQFASNTTGTTTPSISKPSSLIDGQVIVLHVFVRNASATFTTPSGFSTLSGFAQRNSGDGSRSQWFGKKITNAAGEPSSYSVSYSSAGGSGLTLIQLSHVASSPFETNSASANTTGTSRAIGFAGNVSDQSLNLFGMHISASGDAVSWSVSGSEIYDASSTATSSTLSFAAYTQSGVGTPTNTATWSTFTSATGVGCSIKNGTEGIPSSGTNYDDSILLTEAIVIDETATSSIQATSALVLSQSTAQGTIAAMQAAATLELSQVLISAGIGAIGSSLALSLSQIVDVASNLSFVGEVALTQDLNVTNQAGLGLSASTALSVNISDQSSGTLATEQSIGLGSVFSISNTGLISALASLQLTQATEIGISANAAQLAAISLTSNLSNTQSGAVGVQGALLLSPDFAQSVAATVGATGTIALTQSVEIGATSQAAMLGAIDFGLLLLQEQGTGNLFSVSVSLDSSFVADIAHNAQLQASLTLPNEQGISAGSQAAMLGEIELLQSQAIVSAASAAINETVAFTNAFLIDATTGNVISVEMDLSPSFGLTSIAQIVANESISLLPGVGIAANTGLSANATLSLQQSQNLAANARSEFLAALNLTESYQLLLVPSTAAVDRDKRIAIVPFEDRSASVPYENRTSLVPAEV